jgi:hypothetical protein
MILCPICDTDLTIEPCNPCHFIGRYLVHYNAAYYHTSIYPNVPYTDYGLPGGKMIGRFKGLVHIISEEQITKLLLLM